MKQLLITSLFFLTVFFSFPPSVFAHLAGQPPFFKINGEYSNLYPVSVSSVSDIPLPQDLAVKEHTVGEELMMTIEPEQLPFPQELMESTKFLWDFGNGTTGEGLEQTHVYTKPGSYLHTIHADFSAVNESYQPQLIQSTLIHVKPDTAYKLPTVKVKINNKLVSDPLVDFVPIKPDAKISLEAVVAKGTADIASITWDLGDAQKADGEKITHEYASNRLYYFPFVRVTDANGFFADAYAELNNDPEAVQTDEEPNLYLFIGGFVLLQGIVIGYWLFRRRNKKLV